MIRILVLVLAAANLLYFGWSRWVRQEAPRLVEPAAGAPITTANSPAPATSGACSLLGPLAGEARAREVEQLLRDMQIVPVQHTATAEVRNGWWVHVPTADAATQARVLRSIVESGINDAFAMPDDPEFRVSVGVFTDQSRAQVRANAVRALQLEPHVTERMTRETSYWFELPGVAPDRFDMERLAAEGIDTSALQVDACGSGHDGPAASTATGNGTSGLAPARAAV